MKYYVIEIATGDANIAGKAVNEYATRREAVASYHQRLANAMRSDLYESELLIVTDSYGSNIEKAVYSKGAE